MTLKLQGSIVALVTPMLANKAIDFASVQQLIEWHIQEGSDGFVICGSTGEGSTLSNKEKLNLFKAVIDQVNGRKPVIVGTGSNSTAASVQFTKEAYDIGASYSLLTTPYYNKPTQRGLFEHFRSIAQATPDMNHILYNIPSRSACVLDILTASELSQFNNIVGLKDSSTNIDRLTQLKHQCTEHFSLLAGDDDITCEWALAGGDGTISVTANIMPNLMQQMVKAAIAGDRDHAYTLNQKLVNLHAELFCQSNPIPVKWLMHTLGKIEAELRLPLTWLEPEFEQRLLTAYQHSLTGNTQKPS